jgi:hypothetical protein
MIRIPQIQSSHHSVQSREVWGTYGDDDSQITSNIPNPLTKPDSNSGNILGTPRRDLPCTDMVEERKILP